jgi:hypothetical protein
MSAIRRAGGALLHVAGVRAEQEIRQWQRELIRPWREGTKGPAAEVGRWIGVGLAVGTVVAGIAAALRTERPWADR